MGSLHFLKEVKIIIVRLQGSVHEIPKAKPENGTRPNFCQEEGKERARHLRDHQGSQRTEEREAAG